MQKMIVALGFLLTLIPASISADVAPQPKETVKAEPVTAPPILEGSETASYMGEVKVRNVPQGSAVVWDVTPEANAVIRIIKTEKAVLFAGPAGKYKVRVRIYKPTALEDDPIDLFKEVVLTTNKPEPGPGPEPLPPPPTPADKFSYFVIVEDTLKAQAWRGTILGSPLVHSAYNQLQGSKVDPVHRLIDISMEAATPEITKFQNLAKGKDLPWMYLLDENHKVIGDGFKAPLDPQAFALAITPTAPHQRAMGNNPPNEGKLKFAWTEVGSKAAPNVPLIDRANWQEVDLSVFLPAVKDQDGIGACNAFATITCVEACRKQAGLKYIRLSPGYLYGNINDGVDQGSMLEDALAWMTENGSCQSSIIGDLDWRGGRKKPQAAVQDAKNYRILEAYICPDFAAMASALQQGFFINEGLMWHDNFKPDRDGWLPSRGTSVRPGGHALCGYGLAKRTLPNGNVEWGIKTRNSWGTSWGINGNCVIPESLFTGKIGGFWAVRAVSSTPTAFSNAAKALFPSLGGLKAASEFVLKP